MHQARSFDPTDDSTHEEAIGPGWRAVDVVDAVLTRRSGRGHPAAEVIREDSSSLTLATDGEWATLVWVDSLGGSFHSVGAGSGGTFVYDYFGSWSEAPSEFQVPLAHAVEAMEQFVKQGTAATERVIFQPD